VKKLKMHVAAVVAVTVLLLGVVGCGSTRPGASGTSTSKAQGSFTLAFTSPALTSPYYDYVLAGVKEELAKHGQGINLLVESPSSESDVGAQVSIVQDFIQKHVNAMAICAMSNEAIAPVVVQANNANIPVMAFNTPTPWPQGKATSNIGYDQNLAGQIAGKWIAKVLNGKGKIAIILGLPSPFNTERVGGAMSVLKNYPNIKVVTQQEGNWLKEPSYTVTQNILTAHPDINLIYAISDEMALGAEQAVKESGKKVYVLGLDGTLDAFQSIAAGDLNATVNTKPAEEGVDIAKAAIMLKSGQNPPAQMFATPEVVNSSNVQQVLSDLQNLVNKYGYNGK